MKNRESRSRVIRFSALLLPIVACFAPAGAQESIKQLRYPAEVTEVVINSSADDHVQKALWVPPKTNGPRPLLVALHTWSNDYAQAGGEVLYAEWCLQEDWGFIHPDFRGRNRTPEACGSDLVISDVLDAVEFAKENANVDSSRIYLVGVSGGGFGSMLLAARAPQVWAGVSAWCGISDLHAWHQQCQGTKHDRYAKELESVCGGPPEMVQAKQQYTYRSALTWLKKQPLSVNLDLNHGVNDGRTGSVPFTHSLEAFNAVAAPSDRLPAPDVTAFYESQIPPDDSKPVESAWWDRRQPIFRRESGNARVTIFQGGHEIVHGAALNWLAQQRKGQDAVWELNPTKIRDLENAEIGLKSGK